MQKLLLSLMAIIVPFGGALALAPVVSAQSTTPTTTTQSFRMGPFQNEARMARMKTSHEERMVQRKKHLQELVTAGTITQEEANRRIEQMNSQVPGGKRMMHSMGKQMGGSQCQRGTQRTR